MKRLLAILLICTLLLSGCAKKGTQQANISKNVTTPAQDATLGTGNGTQNTVNGTPTTQNATADDQLDKGMDMFDYTVDPLMSEGGYDGTVPQ